MNAGRELDKIIHEKVMGKPLTMTIGPNHSWLVAGTVVNVVVPRYSTDIGAAWLVVERFYKSGWGAGAEMDGHTGCRAFVGQFTAEADTPMEAICLAALKAVGVSL